MREDITCPLPTGVIQLYKHNNSTINEQFMGLLKLNTDSDVHLWFLRRMRLHYKIGSVVWNRSSDRGGVSRKTKGRRFSTSCRMYRIEIFL